MPVTQSLASFIVGTRTDDLPEWSLNEAKRTLINILAVSLSASTSAGSRMLMDWAASEAAAPKTTIVGSALRTSASNAALLNGFLAHIQDYDDTPLPHRAAPHCAGVARCARGCRGAWNVRQGDAGGIRAGR